MTVQGSEDLTLVNPDPGAWTVTIDDVPQVIDSVMQVGALIQLGVPAMSASEVRLAYVGGAYVIGTVSGLPLQPVTDFDVMII